MRLMAAFLPVVGALLAGCTADVTGPNRPPVARAGGDRVVEGLDPVGLDGRASCDPDGDPLTYHWQLIKAPPGGTGSLSAQDATASLTPDTSGSWFVALQVDDGALRSQRDVVRVDVLGGCATDEDCPEPADWCAGEAVCDQGRCRIAPRDCADDDPCTQDLCDEALDTCWHPAVDEPPGTEGSEQAGTCQDQVDNDCDGLTDGADPDCVADCTLDAQCDDQRACTEDLCAADGRCRNTPLPDDTPCDDANPCTLADACQAGACIGVVRDCGGFGDQCKLGVCDPGTGQCAAEPAFEGDPCEDGDACTAGETCGGGACAGGQPLDCSGLDDACNQGVCDPGTGQCAARPVDEGLACDDAQACTTGETCTAGLCGGGAPTDCSHLDDDCGTGTCDPGTGDCRIQPANEGQPCDDGLPCTAGEFCTAGTCGGGVPSDCSHLDDDCHAGVCDPDTGACSTQPANEGQPCDDGLFCTDGETCSAGACGGGGLRDCSAQDNQCNLGVCDEDTTACVQAPREDGTECGVRSCGGTEIFMQTCLGGRCISSAPVLDCDDGDACNGAETCDQAACQPGGDLPDGTACTPPPGPGVTSCAYQCATGTCSPPPYANPASPCDAADPRLAGCWTFDADDPVGTPGGVKDGSGNANHGQASGVSYVGGLDGDAVHFPNAGSIHVADSASLDCAQAITFEAWVRPTSLPGSGRRGIIDNDGQYGLFLYAGGLLRCSASSEHYVAAPQVDRWTLVTCVIDADNDRAIIYYDGQPVLDEAYPGSIGVDNAGDLTIGANSPSGDPFDGQIDTVRVWCAALDPDEICWAAAR